MSRKSLIIIIVICSVIVAVSIGSLIATNTTYVADESFQAALAELAKSNDTIDIGAFEAFWSAQAGHTVEVYYNKAETMIMARYRNVTYTAPLPLHGSVR